MITFTPQNWFWAAEDGRIFSSAAGAIVPASDPAYQAWIAAGNVATPWPRDDQGGQTALALDEAMAPWGLRSGLAPRTLFTPREVIQTLFTPAEQQAIFQAAQTPAGWQISMFITLVTATPQVDITNADFVTDVGIVQTAGLITADRAKQILAGTPAPTT